MSRFIDADALDKHIFHDIPVQQLGSAKVMGFVRNLIAEAPTVEQKKGEWIMIDWCANEGIYCSKCHAKIFEFVYKPQKKLSNFCPNCGADMRGEHG